MSKTAQITWDVKTGLYKATFPFDKDMVAFMKLIPAANRSYDPATYTWFFEEKYFTAIETAFKKKWFNVFILEKTKVESYTNQFKSSNNNGGYSNAPPIEHDVNIFSRLTGLDLSKAKGLNLIEATKFYRLAARKYHPDINPSAAPQMAELNETWQRLKETYYK